MMTREQREVLEEYLAADKTQREVIKQAYAVALADIKTQTQALMNKVQTSSVLYQLQYKKTMEEQIEGILTLLESQLVNDTTDYLAGVYNNGFYGSAYSMAAQGVPIAFGVDQKQLAAAINVKIDDYLFSDRIRDNVDNLKRVTKMEITRGIANGSTYAEIAMHIAQHTDESIRRAQIITRTEAHRVQQTAREDAMQEAKKRGADIVKMWDSTLDGKTRRTHRKLDGQIKELDEPFEVDGHKAMRPGGFGRPEEDINCRCQVLERARWALNGKRRKLDNENQFDENGNLNYISTDDKRYREWKTELEQAVKKQGQKKADDRFGFKRLAVEPNYKDATQKANPGYSTDKRYRINCQRCCPTYEMRRRGYDVVALPYGTKTDAAYKGWRDIFKDAQWLPPGGRTGKAQMQKIVETVQEFGDGARIEIYVQWKYGSAHVFMCENVGGEIRFIDPQTGNLDVSRYFDEIKPSKTLYARLDQLEPTELIKECMKNND